MQLYVGKLPYAICTLQQAPDSTAFIRGLITQRADHVTSDTDVGPSHFHTSADHMTSRFLSAL